MCYVSILLYHMYRYIFMNCMARLDLKIECCFILSTPSGNNILFCNATAGRGNRSSFMYVTKKLRRGSYSDTLTCLWSPFQHPYVSVAQLFRVQNIHSDMIRRCWYVTSSQTDKIWNKLCASDVHFHLIARLRLQEENG